MEERINRRPPSCPKIQKYLQTSVVGAVVLMEPLVTNHCQTKAQSSKSKSTKYHATTRATIFKKEKGAGVLGTWKRQSVSTVSHMLSFLPIY